MSLAISVIRPHFFCVLLALRVPPAVTRLKDYCWLHIHTQSVGPGNLAQNLCSMCCAQTLLARDPVIKFECSPRVTTHQIRFVGLQARPALQTYKTSPLHITKLALYVYRGCPEAALEF